VREIRTLRAMWRALETEPYGVTAPVLDPTRASAFASYVSRHGCFRMATLKVL
jgi:hypothetical protein